MEQIFSETVYRVKKGDSAERVAEEFGVSARLIAAVNGGGEWYEGMRVLIPARPARMHRVMPGETVEGIAARYGVSPERLLADNRVDRIFTGLDLAVFGELQ